MSDKKTTGSENKNNGVGESQDKEPKTVSGKSSKSKSSSKSKRPSSTETIVVSIGGSLIAPDEIDTSFLLALKRCLIGYTSARKRFILVCGGGGVSRKYLQAASKMAKISSQEADWLGIHGTRLNAYLVNTVLGRYSGTDIIADPKQKVQLTSRKPVAVSGGWKPGWSTDYVAVILAHQVGAQRVINLTNIDYVYDKDPKQYSDAQAIKNITWKDFRAMLPKSWSPGLSSPFDPVASQQAQKHGMEVAIINGKKLAQFEHYLNGRTFRGTLIQPE